jgi:hypothetical protein
LTVLGDCDGVVQLIDCVPEPNIFDTSEKGTISHWYDPKKIEMADEELPKLLPNTCNICWPTPNNGYILLILGVPITLTRLGQDVALFTSPGIVPKMYTRAGNIPNGRYASVLQVIVCEDVKQPDGGTVERDVVREINLHAVEAIEMEILLDIWLLALKLHPSNVTVFPATMAAGDTAVINGWRREQEFGALPSPM